ncbi:hypothetical protein [Halocynthiibacter styelae]|uniref:Uncharacterized protein n=1 Tax=Halocynthiibacter styelae TaxID=2761955 RepID=A0A8J7IF46_9RHOB|nr:hypothetical protein [Paenihalocynthiibacter styelae]MBI1494532.1 hypothetical protein [Paenihalocynthiibacter styelae]
MTVPYIELTLGETVIILPLGTSVENISLLLSARRFNQGDDPEVDATCFELPDDGVEITAKNGVLSTVFLYLASSDDHKVNFKGSTNFLGRDFFETPSAHQFEQSLAQQGFARSSRQYPNAIDMLTEEIRLRYENRSDQQMVCFDDGTRIRGN